MNAMTRRKMEMGARALEFSRAHPDESAGYTTALKELAELLERSERLAIQQRQGVSEVRAATAMKRELHKAIRQREQVHISRAAQRAVDQFDQAVENSRISAAVSFHVWLRPRNSRIKGDSSTSTTKGIRTIHTMTWGSAIAPRT